MYCVDVFVIELVVTRYRLYDRSETRNNTYYIYAFTLTTSHFSRNVFFCLIYPICLLEAFFYFNLRKRFSKQKQFSLYSVHLLHLFHILAISNSNTFRVTANAEFCVPDSFRRSSTCSLAPIEQSSVGKPSIKVSSPDG